MIVKRDTGFYIGSNSSSLSASVRSNQTMTINPTSSFFAVLCNFVSVMASTEKFALINKDLKCAIFGRTLFMLRCPKWRHWFFNTFHSESFSGNVCSGVLILEDVTQWSVSLFITWLNGRFCGKISIDSNKRFRLIEKAIFKYTHIIAFFMCFHIAFDTGKRSLAYPFTTLIKQIWVRPWINVNTAR